MAERRGHHEPLGDLWAGRAAVRARRPYRRGAAGPARALGQRSLRAGDPQRRALRSRCGRHEERPRRDGLRGRAPARTRRVHGHDRLPDHQRRGRCSPARHQACCRDPASARHQAGLRDRRRSDRRHAVRRPHHHRPARLARLQSARARQAGPCRLPGEGREPDPPPRTGARRARRDRMGSRQRAFPADLVPGLEPQLRHRREQRDPGRGRACLQLPLLHRVDGRRPQSARA